MCNIAVGFIGVLITGTPTVLREKQRTTIVQIKLPKRVRNSLVVPKARLRYI